MLVGLDAFVGASEADFVQKGVAWANDLQLLASLRAGMRERCAKSPVFNGEIVAAGLARALRIMWRRWCEGQPATSFDVSQEASRPSPVLQ
jgi:predicted O-linked N-acetylglucosamine transferase (SPINDLY family)